MTGFWTLDKMLVMNYTRLILLPYMVWFELFPADLNFYNMTIIPTSIHDTVWMVYVQRIIDPFNMRNKTYIFSCNLSVYFS